MTRSGVNSVFGMLALWALLVLQAAFPVEARGRAERRPEPRAPGVLIAADRVTGFVPLTVTLYGRLGGRQPAALELCRWRVAQMFGGAVERPAAGEPEPDGTHAPPIEPPACQPSRVTPTTDGYVYEHDLRFDQPGLYEVRMTLVDDAGRRQTSNVVRVTAY